MLFKSAAVAAAVLSLASTAAAQASVATVYRYIDATATVYADYCPCPVSVATIVAPTSGASSGSTGSGAAVAGSGSGAGSGTGSGTGSSAGAVAVAGAGAEIVVNGGSGTGTGSGSGSGSGSGAIAIPGTGDVTFSVSVQVSTYVTVIVLGPGNTVTSTVTTSSTVTVPVTATTTPGGGAVIAPQNTATSTPRFTNGTIATSVVGPLPSGVAQNIILSTVNGGAFVCGNGVITFDSTAAAASGSIFSLLGDGRLLCNGQVVNVSPSSTPVKRQTVVASYSLTLLSVGSSTPAGSFQSTFFLSGSVLSLTNGGLFFTFALNVNNQLAVYISGQTTPDGLTAITVTASVVGASNPSAPVSTPAASTTPGASALPSSSVASVAASQPVASSSSAAAVVAASSSSSASAASVASVSSASSSSAALVAASSSSSASVASVSSSSAASVASSSSASAVVSPSPSASASSSSAAACPTGAAPLNIYAYAGSNSPQFAGLYSNVYVGPAVANYQPALYSNSQGDPTQGTDPDFGVITPSANPSFIWAAQVGCSTILNGTNFPVVYDTTATADGTALFFNTPGSASTTQQSSTGFVVSNAPANDPNNPTGYPFRITLSNTALTLYANGASLISVQDTSAFSTTGDVSVGPIFLYAGPAGTNTAAPASA